MALKTFKPYTKSTRGTIIVTKKNLWKGKPIKSLTIGKKSSSGRNNLGRITSRRRGSGHKQKYREIDFYRNKHDMEAVVERIEYDPNRTSHIMLVKYDDGERSYMLLPQKIKIGDKIISGNKKEIKIGNCMPLHDIPAGTAIHNVEMKPGGGAKIARAAGSSVQITGSDGEYSIIKLVSGEIRKIISRAKATIGVLSNPDQKNIKIGKAGRNRWLGIRPSVRGVVMNPVDHPHGGGEGKSSGGRNPVSPWGQSAKGLKTRNNKRTNKYIISRRKKKRA
jgi:large subunit ribosomal protein L2